MSAVVVSQFIPPFTLKWVCWVVQLQLCDSAFELGMFQYKNSDATDNYFHDKANKPLKAIINNLRSDIIINSLTYGCSDWLKITFNSGIQLLAFYRD